MKLIILDRDGVINEENPNYVDSAEKWIPIPNSLEAIARLSHANYRIVVASNQAGLERRRFDIDVLNQIHQKMHRLLSEAGGIIEAIFFCPAKDDQHPDRKPNPGMLLDIARRLNYDLSDVPFVGDSLRDIQAAKAANAIPFLVRTGNGQHTLEKHRQALTGVSVFDDLGAVANHLLEAKS